MLLPLRDIDMTENPLVSVVIPCYNQGRFLGEAIESVQAQTYPHYEIIVVDDGSTDNTDQVAARYENVRCIRQTNRGLSGARNSGLNASKGEWLVFLDADDRLLPEALEAGVARLQAHPECAFAYGAYNYMTAEGEATSAGYHVCVEENQYLELLRQGNYIGAIMAVVFRRSVFDSVGHFNPRLRSVEDYDLYLRIAEKFPFICHDEIVAEYRQHGTSLTRNHGFMLKSSLDVLHANWERVKGNNKLEEAYRSGVSHHQELYSERMIQRIRAQVRRGAAWRSVGQDTLTLLQHCPQVFARHAGRKLYCFVFRIKSDYDQTAQGMH